MKKSLFCEKDALKNFAKFTGKHLCDSLIFNKVADLQFYLKKALAQVSSSEFCKISKNTFSHKTPLLAASSLTESFTFCWKDRYYQMRKASFFLQFMGFLRLLQKHNTFQFLFFRLLLHLFHTFSRNQEI